MIKKNNDNDNDNNNDDKNLRILLTTKSANLSVRFGWSMLIGEEREEILPVI